MKASDPPVPVIDSEGPAQIRELVLALAFIPDPDIRAQALEQGFALHTDSKDLAGFGRLLLALAADPSGTAAGIFDTMLGILTIPERPRNSRFRDAIFDLPSDVALHTVVGLAIVHARLGRLIGRGCSLDLGQILLVMRLFFAFRDLIRARFSGKELERDMLIARGMFQILNYQDDSARGTGVRRPGALAGRLASAAARLLPAEDRPRYQEEFRAELVDLAQGQSSRQAQVAYASRLLASAWQLRAELRALRRGGAVQ
jgi:hypothetical protein